MEFQDDMRTLIGEQAAEWSVRIRDEQLSAADRRRYLAWLKQSPNHISEMLRVSGMTRWLHTAKLMGSAASSGRAPNVAALTAGATAANPLSRPGWPANWWNWSFATGVCALSLVLVVIGAVARFVFFNSTIDTNVGEWRRVALSDGSVVNVGPRSRLSYDFTDKRRSVYLLQGEALFQVAKDTHRPFFVTTELAVVRAVGTQFGVARRDGQVFVTVKEGKVAVTQGKIQLSASASSDPPSGGSNEGVPLALTANQQITVTARAWPARAQRVDATRELAWAQGQLIFDDKTTVAQAAEEFNRRNRIQIVVDDPLIAAKPVCCVFNVDDPESFAQSVATGSRNHAVALVRDGPDILRLVPAEPKS